MKKRSQKNAFNEQVPADKDELSQADLLSGVNTVGEQSGPHAPLETPDGKNNGELPAAYRGQRTNRT